MSWRISKDVFRKLKHRKNKEFWWSRLARFLHYKFVIPMKREKDSPHFIAHSVMIGLFVGFTPTIGVQMPIILVIWWVARKLFKFNFSLWIAIAWSWVSNGATMIPFYYVFYVTGRAIIPSEEKTFSFRAFSNHIRVNLYEVDDMVDSLQFLIGLLEKIGSSMLIGSLPWAISLGLLGYWLSLRAALGYQKIREQRMLKKLQKKNHP